MPGIVMWRVADVHLVERWVELDNDGLFTKINTD
jgi:hypothetical protein